MGNEEELIQLSEEDIVLTSEMKVEESENPYVLGVLSGIFMVIEDDNGNGRYYLNETIDKGILENDYVKRMLECKSLLGEAHHPLERTSIWSDEACICTRELWKDPSRKYLMGKADILDTPKGRIVYTLAKYGTKLGISARANGKGVKQGKHLVIKPENYYFKTFDVVLNPGFKEARPLILEKDGVTPMRVYEEEDTNIEEKMYEEFKDMIENNSCDMKMLRDYIEYSESDKLKELITLMEERTTEPLGDDTSCSESQLREEIDSLKRENEAMAEKIKSFEITRANYESEISGYKAQNEEISEELESCKAKSEEIRKAAEDLVEELTEEIKTRDSKISDMASLIEAMEEENMNMTQTVAESTSKIEKLEKDCKGLKVMLEEVEEPKEEKRVIENPVNKVNLFGTSVEAINEEVSVEIGSKSVSVSNNKRISMIKSLGGK